MRCRILVCSLVFALCSISANAAPREGTPVYYNNRSVNRSPVYVGSQRQLPSINQRDYTYYVPRQKLPSDLGSATTPAGVATGKTPPWILSLDYGRRFANFEFKTGVNSILKWDDMIFNEITARVESNFNIKNYDLFAYGEYGVGNMAGGGFSMDYDLEPYDPANKDVGIFTISVGDQSGSTKNLRLAFGAKNIWDWAGWKFSPSIGYEIFQHNLEMNNHYYPNPGVYLPLLDLSGNYVFGDNDGLYHSVAQSDQQSAIDNGWYQICLSPEDIMLGQVGPDGSLTTNVPYSQNPLNPYAPWGVLPGQCVIIGGDGPVLVKGTTHIYNTTWSGLFIGMTVEKQMTYKDNLRFYLQVGMPNYSSEGIWPNRTDWQQSPSFIDEGNGGAYSYRAEMEYSYQISDRLRLSLKADMNLFHVGKIGGELYVAAYTDYVMDESGQYVFTDGGVYGGNACDPYTTPNCFPVLQTVEAHTVKIEDSLKYATWQSFGLHLGVKYSF
ncbi:MAG: hypothetical protein ACOX7D_03385 [Alphaproteobacteria bacterium]|jgi:hypothetical protein